MSETVWVVFGGSNPEPSPPLDLVEETQWEWWVYSPRFGKFRIRKRKGQKTQVHRTKLAAVQDAATRLEAIYRRKQQEANDACEAARAMRERAKTLEQGR
jgi:hypothetical protein